VWCDTHNEYYEVQSHMAEWERCLSFATLSEENSDKIYAEEFYFSCTQCDDFDMCSRCVLLKHEMEFKEAQNPKTKHKAIQHTQSVECMEAPPRKRQKTDECPQVWGKSVARTQGRKRAREEVTESECESMVSVVSMDTTATSVAPQNYEKLERELICEKRKIVELSKESMRKDMQLREVQCELEIRQVQTEGFKAQLEQLRKDNAQLRAENAQVVGERDAWKRDYKALQLQIATATQGLARTFAVRDDDSESVV